MELVVRFKPAAGAAECALGCVREWAREVGATLVSTRFGEVGDDIEAIAVVIPSADPKRPALVAMAEPDKNGWIPRLIRETATAVTAPAPVAPIETKPARRPR